MVAKQNSGVTGVEKALNRRERWTLDGTLLERRRSLPAARLLSDMGKVRRIATTSFSTAFDATALISNWMTAKAHKTFAGAGGK